MYEPFGRWAQHLLRRRAPTIQDQKHARKDPLPFEGDRDSDGDGPSPPLAWTLMWQGIYSNRYGYYVPEAMRRWGYVVWDAARLERTGAKKVLQRQRESVWTHGNRRLLIPKPRLGPWWEATLDLN